MLLDFIKRRDAETIRGEKLIGGNCLDETAQDYAILRSCLWALWRDRGPVHSTRIVNLAIEVSGQSAVGRAKQERILFRQALEELSEVGDVVSLPQGRWLPANTREVIFESEEEERLIVGGLPSSVLPADLRKTIVHYGPYRRTNSHTLVEALQLPKESLESWAGVPKEGLDLWCKDIMGKELAVYTESPDGFKMSLYTPSQFDSRKPQFFRWRAPRTDVSGRFLARRERMFGGCEFRIVEVSKGKVERSGSFLRPGEARRLMYGIDSESDRPVEVVVQRERGSLIVILSSEVPRSEQRLFGALGTLKESEVSYPRTWQFAERYQSVVLERLRSLKVKLVDTRRRRLSA